MTTHQTSFRVRYAETDQMGVVYYANYFVWMEIGRSEYCRSAGVRYRDMELEEGLLLAVVGANCRYLSPARYDDEITVTTSIAEANRRIVEFHYEIACGPRSVASGHTRHIFLHRDMSPASLPARFWPAFSIPSRASSRNGMPAAAFLD